MHMSETIQFALNFASTNEAVQTILVNNKKSVYIQI